MASIAALSVGVPARDMERAMPYIGNSSLKDLEEYAKARPDYRLADDSREGVRISTKNGFFLLRLSVHDPVMPINFESDTEGGCVGIAGELYSALLGSEGVDLASLREYAEQ